MVQDRNTAGHKKWEGRLGLCMISINVMSHFQYFYEIKVNGINVHQTENTQPDSYRDVKVYAANPWLPAVNGKIKNLAISRSNEVNGKCKVYW